MIPPSELRIGNFIYCSDAGIFKVESLDAYSEFNEQRVEVKIILVNEEYDTRRCEPILLTEDMLESMGLSLFENKIFIDQNAYSIGQDADFLIWSSGFIAKRIDPIDYIIIAKEINSIHLIQNVICDLIGRELQLNKTKPQTVKATFLFPNGIIATVGLDGQQIGELQGEYSIELEKKIKSMSDENTEWHGFGKNNGVKPAWMDNL